MVDLYHFFLSILLTALGALVSGSDLSPLPSPLVSADSPQLGIYFGVIADVQDPPSMAALVVSRSYAPTPLPTPPPHTLRWRMGVGAPQINLLAYDWPDERPGWVHNWTFGIIGAKGIPTHIEDVRLGLRGAETGLGMEYAPMLRTPGGRLYFTADMIGQVARAYPGHAWLVGNEPDVLAQDWATPAEYARAYRFAYQAIKEADPTAMVIAGNLSQSTPLRLAYLDAFWDAYQAEYGEEPPVDVWGMHAFILREEAGNWGVGVPPGLPVDAPDGRLWEVKDHDDPRLVEQQVRDMRRWMADHGQGDKPLWVTEYGILMPMGLGFSPQRVERFMLGSFDLFDSLRDPALGLAADDDRLVQRWLWFSAYSADYPAGNLFDADGRPTGLMDAMAGYLREREGMTR